MAVYRGKIDIVNMSNIAATAGVGIQNTRILYAISNSGVVPPDLVDVSLTTTEGDVLTFASTGSSFRVIDGILWAWQGDTEVALSTEKDLVIGLKGWTTEVPQVGAGQYLWTKTIYYYTNNTQTVTYGVFRQGEDGPQGPAGVASSSYHLNCNQTEILKFVDNSGNTTISPEILTVSIYKDEPFQEGGQIQITNLNPLNFTAEIYNINTGIWNPISSAGVIILDSTHTFNINLKKLIEEGATSSDVAATQLLFSECIIKLSYIHVEGEGDKEETFSLVDFLNVRYGMSKDMAQLSVKANGIVASMQDSKLVFDSTGLTVQNGSFTIRDSEGNNLLYSDNGNLALRGNVYADGGYFKGELQAATGSFAGSLTAATGTFAGELSAATGSFSGDISAASGTIGGFKIENTRLTSLKTDEKEAPNIILDGREGTIVAENIILGTGAQIKDYITIGNIKEFSEDIAPKNIEDWVAGLIGSYNSMDTPPQNSSSSFLSNLSTPRGIKVTPGERYLNNFKGVAYLTIGMYDENGEILSRDSYSSEYILIPTNCYYIRIMISSKNNYEEYKKAFADGTIIPSLINIKNSQIELKSVTSYGDSFIRVLDSDKELLSFRADGTLRISNNENTIIISGADGSIVSQSFYNGLGWKISNTESIFNDVTVRGSIRASVLEYGETQAIGGALLVRPSSRIIKEERSGSNTKLTLEQTEGFNVGDYCRIDVQTANSVEHRFFVVTNITDKIITVSGDATGSYGKPIVSFGQTNEDKNKNDNVGICINGSLDSSFSTPQSISVFDFNPTTQIITPRVVLGKLPNEESIYGYAAGTYGLYAENVLLKGSLVTQTDTSGSITYSGISTLHSGADAPASHRYNNWFGEGNTGEILLWAGATGTSKEEVENSKFFVDRNGNLFAGSGYFKGTIITDATITASEIETAVIRGSNDKPGEPALKIEDAAKGIDFTATIEGEEITVFKVTTDSIVANVPNFVFNSNFTVGGNGSLVVPNLYVIGSDTGAVTADATNQEAIMFDKHRISYVNNFKQNELTGTTKGYVDFTSNMIFSPDGTSQILELSDQEVRVRGENTSLYLENSIRYGEIMEYKPVYDKDDNLIGYDLYVE